MHADLFYTHSSHGYPIAYECHLLSHIKQLGLNGRSLRGALLACSLVVYLLTALCLGATFFSWKSFRDRAQTKTNLRGALLACTFAFDLSMERFSTPMTFYHAEPPTRSSFLCRSFSTNSDLRGLLSLHAGYFCISQTNDSILGHDYCFLSYIQQMRSGEKEPERCFACTQVHLPLPLLSRAVLLLCTRLLAFAPTHSAMRLNQLTRC